jgi:hypothetical protein
MCGLKMAALRKILMYCSALAALAIFIVWLILHRNFDILPFGMIFLFSANAFYLYCSAPTIKTSDILGHASSKLTLASLELRYLSQEAQIREAEAEKLRLAKAESEQYKLQVAKDMLEHLQLKLSSRRSQAINVQQIPHQARAGHDAIVAPAAAAPVAKGDETDPANRPITKKVQPAMAAELPPAATVLN